MSLILFNAYGEIIMRKIFDGWGGGIAIGDRHINNLRYTDTLILAASEEELIFILQKGELLEKENRVYEQHL